MHLYLLLKLLANDAALVDVQSCMLCHPSQEIILQSSRSRPSRRATPQHASSVRTVYKAKSSILCARLSAASYVMPR